MEESKACNVCGETKPVSEFYKHAKNKANNGLAYNCKSCHAEKNRKRRETRPFENATAQARHRAAKYDLEFDLTEAYLEAIWTGYCPVFGTKFNLPGAASRTPQTPTLDRVIPHKGYIQGNVVWISDLANRIKQEATSAEVQAVATWLHQTEKEIAQHETD
jgi:hypothetical protein